MGISGIGPGSLILILAIVLLLFGTKRIKSLGGDLGGAVKGFKKAMSDEDTKKDSLTKDETNNTAEKESSENEKSS